MRQTRVVLARLPGILRDALREIISAQPDMAVVAELGDDLADRIDALAPDVLISGLGGAEPATVAREVWRRAPWLKVLAVEGGGRRVWLYELRPHQVLLGEASPAALLDAIRQPAALEATAADGSHAADTE